MGSLARPTLHTNKATMSQRSNLIDQAVAALRARIRSGEWAVGERIPTEPDLTQLLGVALQNE